MPGLRPYRPHDSMLNGIPHQNLSCNSVLQENLWFGSTLSPLPEGEDWGEERRPTLHGPVLGIPVNMLHC